jgi:hypothetical protein
VVANSPAVPPPAFRMWRRHIVLLGGGLVLIGSAIALSLPRETAHAPPQLAPAVAPARDPLGTKRADRLMPSEEQAPEAFVPVPVPAVRPAVPRPSIGPAWIAVSPTPAAAAPSTSTEIPKSARQSATPGSHGSQFHGQSPASAGRSLWGARDQRPFTAGQSSGYPKRAAFRPFMAPSRPIVRPLRGRTIPMRPLPLRVRR